MSPSLYADRLHCFRRQTAFLHTDMMRGVASHRKYAYRSAPTHTKGPLYIAITDTSVIITIATNKTNMAFYRRGVRKYKYELAPQNET